MQRYTISWRIYSSLLLLTVFAWSSPAFGQHCLAGTWHGDWSWTKCPPDFICSIGTVFHNIDMNLTQTGSQVTGTTSNDTKAASQNKLTNSILRNPVYGGCSKTNDQFVLASLLSILRSLVVSRKTPNIRDFPVCDCYL